MSLSKLRREIDGIDAKIVPLLNKRARVSLEIGRLKKKTKTSIYAPDREKEIYDNIAALNCGPLSDDTIRATYREIMSGSLSLEKSIKIAYLGPPATFTHLAAMKKFGSAVNYAPCDSITDIFTEVERGRCDYGVVPIENSIEGAINHTLDMLIETDLRICSEIVTAISHNLMSGYPLKKIKKVYSNPQVFGQCRIWLEANLPGAQLIDVSSTAKAAEAAARQKNSAAIGSKLAADCYGLKILAESIEAKAYNITRFLVIGKQKVSPTKKDKTSLMFSVKDRVGALHDALVAFKRNSVNLTKIESRPSKKKAWEYYFFVDVEGHIEQEPVKKAVSQLKKHCHVLKILGSYPSA